MSFRLRSAAKKGQGRGRVYPSPGGYTLPTALSTETYNPNPAGFLFTPPAEYLSTVMDTSYLSPATGKTVHTCTTASDFTTALTAVANATTSTAHVIVLTSGNTFEGEFVLPRKQSAQIGVWTYIMSSAVYNGTFAVSEGSRVAPGTSGYAIVETPNSAAAIRTTQTQSDLSACSHYRLIGLEVRIKTTYQGTDQYGVVVISHDSYVANPTQLSHYPHDFVVDRCYVHGHAVGTPIRQIRGIAFNAARCAAIDSHVSGFRSDGADTQAIAGWSTPGPIKIVNNYLEGAGENFILGGSPPGLYGVVASDIEFRRNYVKKPISWGGEDPAAIAVKNLFELKSASRVLVECNVMENSWHDGQEFAVIFQVIDDSGGAATIDNVTFRWNWVKNVAGALNLLGATAYSAPSGTDARQPTRRVQFKHNLWTGLGSPDTSMPGSGKCWQLLCYSNPYGGYSPPQPTDWAFDHNTVVYHPSQSSGKASFLLGDRSTYNGFTGCVVTNNIFPGATSYGLWSGNAATEGTAGLNGFVYNTQWTCTHNAFTSEPSGDYPANNQFPANDAALGLDANFRPSVGSGLRGAGSDGLDIGADTVNLHSYLTGVT